MPAPVEELRRGRIFYAVFPFASAFPAQVRGHATEVTSVERYAAAFGGARIELAVGVRLRPVLLLHDGARGDREDVICLRINSVKPQHRRDNDTWRRIRAREHPFFVHLPEDDRYGLPQESLIDITGIGTLHKSAILGGRGRHHLGRLDRPELQAVDRRLIRALQIDLTPQITFQVRELLERGGYRRL